LTVPTVKPRYTFTDTGKLEALLDAAQRRWPEIADRKLLLLRLAEEGARMMRIAEEQLADQARRELARAALERLPGLIDPEILLSGRAWN
jgi:hypothetical protein